MYNFGLDPDQQALRAMLRRFVDEACTREHLRSVIETPDGLATDQWRGFGDLGLFGLGVPEADGGSGLGYLDLALAMETLGRAALPAPVIETLIVADLIVRAGTPEQRARYLPRIVTGELLATYAIDEPGGYWTPSAVQATATEDADGYRLAGTKSWSAYAGQADLTVCAVRAPVTEGEAGISLMLVDRSLVQGRLTVLNPIDDGYRLAALDLDGVHVAATDLLGKAGEGWSLWHRATQLGAVLGSAEQLGCMERALEIVVAYGAIRTQFGKLIGSFQAMKHRCADILIDLEACRGTVYYGAYALQHDLPDADLAVSSAKAFASDVSVRACERALQSLGAIGFTWEHDIHFYLKRAKRLELTFGDATFHRELIAQRL